LNFRDLRDGNRHGNRLDAADKQWHLTSPAPYDPPLTYGGWLQCRRLGARIASILREREAEDEAAYAVANNDRSSDTKQLRKRRRYRVILHSSPFLRCIQTAIAISSGIASTPSSYPRLNGYLPTQVKLSPSTEASFVPNQRSSQSRPAILTDLCSVDSPQSSSHVEKTILRIDPFLGEWASPDYFDHITPPPESSLMLMTAKAELLRKENYNTYSFAPRASTPTAPSQLWNSPTQPRASGLEDLPRIGQALPGSPSDGLADRRGSHKVSLSEPAISTGYIAPVPSYAVSSSAQIPQGYVAHARDACVDIDYQWDSTRDPLAWGDGGVLPEEWAGMHQRFRKGLKRLVDWYSTSDHPDHMVTKTPTTPGSGRFDGNVAENSDGDEDVEIENVVILVSHGAGCNALVGGITNQPVLADVPMSSLTMARRRTDFKDNQGTLDGRTMASLDDALLRNTAALQEIYELPMFANTDHLVNPENVSRSASINASSRGRDARGFSSALRDVNFGAHYSQPRDNRSVSVSTPLGPSRKSLGGPSSAVRSPSLISSGGIKGGITVGSGVTSFGAAARTNSWGLWTPKQEPVRPEEEPDLPMTLDFSHEKNAKKSPTPETIDELPESENGPLPVLPPSVQSEEHDKFDSDAFHSVPSGSGMWGAPRPPDEAEKLRDFSSQKRRWTVTERQPVTGS
jgi:hypothetical protein